MRRYWRRIGLGLVVVVGILEVLWFFVFNNECNKETRPKPFSVSVYDTPFAVVAATVGQTVCPPHVGTTEQWNLVLVNQSVEPSAKKIDPNQVRRSWPTDPGSCVYEWVNPKKAPAPQDFKDISAVPDSAAVAVSDGSTGGNVKLPPQVLEPLKNMFDRQARGTLAKSELSKVRGLLSKATGKIRIAVVDATPKGLNSPDTSNHGFVVSRIIASLACADPNAQECQDRVKAYLALPLKAIDLKTHGATLDLTNGGYYGTPSQLLEAITGATNDWKSTDQRLIINLSLGWDPIKLDPGDPNVERIQTSLEAAVCRGALVIASAGNPTGSDNPVRPAAFEAFTEPTDERCSKLGVPRPVDAKGKSGVPRPEGTQGQDHRSYAPLLHAVGMVDAQDRKFLFARRWGQPRLAAFGLDVIVPGPENSFTPPMTGTSMSAAVVSGVAAAVWLVHPDWSAPMVMSRLYDAGLPLQPPEMVGKPPEMVRRTETEFCLGQANGPCREWNVRRIALCQALKDDLPGLQCAQGVPLAKELPYWEDASTSKGSPVEPCRVRNCGIPEGTMAGQLLAGTLPQGFGIGGCPGCTLTVATRVLGGTPNQTPREYGYDFTASLGVSFVSGSGLPQSPQYYPINPAYLQKGQFFSVGMAPFPGTVTGAGIEWYYPTGGAGSVEAHDETGVWLN